jgi:diguanylate cyclase (GGDEF)-like protein
MVFFTEMDSPLFRREQKPLNPSPFTDQKKQLDSFKIRLHEEILRSQRRNYPLCLIRLALESAAPENDRSNELVEFLRLSIREYDMVCSVKQDEFAVAFPETNVKTAQRIATRLRESLVKRIWADAVSQITSPTIGIACFPQDGTTAEDLLNSAQDKLTQARSQK